MRVIFGYYGGNGNSRADSTILPLVQLEERDISTGCRMTLLSRSSLHFSDGLDSGEGCNRM